MLVSEFDYELPEELIAQYPTDKRDFSKMLVIDPANQTIEHAHFFDIVNYLDDHEYMSMVESLLRRGFVFVEALNIAFKNFEGVEL